MRYELTDNEWSAIKPMLPKKRAAPTPIVGTAGSASYWNTSWNFFLIAEVCLLM